MPTETTGDDKPPPVRPVLLSRWGRLAAGAFGTASVGGGGAAVFLTENQVGSTALLVLGSVALLMSLTGRVPDRISREGIDYHPATEVVKNLLTDESTPEPVREVVAVAVQEEADRASLRRDDNLSAHAAAVLFEAHVLRSLAAVPRPGGTSFIFDARTAGIQVDGVLYPLDEPPLSDLSHRVIVEVAIKLDRSRLQRDLNRVTALGAGALIHITTADTTVRSHEVRDMVYSQSNLAFYGLMVMGRSSSPSGNELSNVLSQAWEAVHNPTEGPIVFLAGA